VEEAWQRLLRDALAVLALPADEQAHAFGPACVACELLNDFDHARSVALGNARDLSEDQRGSLDRIDSTMRAMDGPDFECFNNEVVRRQVWQALRELAAAALRAFGWEGVVTRPAVEIQREVWSGPSSEAEQQGHRPRRRSDLVVPPQEDARVGGAVPEAHIVYCESRMLLDRGRYESWRDIQDAYPDYKASLGPWSEADIVAFLADDFGVDESRWPFTRRAIADFFRSGERLLVCQEAETRL